VLQNAGSGSSIREAARVVSRVVGHLLMAVAVAASLGVWSGLPAHAATITLVHVNDTHSYLDAYGPKDRYVDGTLGGWPRLRA
jgi:2',3'-cyclic-nucleotide 2'-phosphodiesterase (5'-nucleotidase family)